MIGSIVLWTFYAYIWSQMALYVACNSLRLCTRNMKSHPRVTQDIYYNIDILFLKIATFSVLISISDIVGRLKK